MTNLNQVSTVYDHEQVVIDSLIDQIKSAQLQINLKGKFIAHVDSNDDPITISVSESLNVKPIPIQFSRVSSSLKKALAHINKYVTVSPTGVSSSAKDGNFSGVSA